MRVLYLADIRFPIERANGRQTMETAHALARRGHDVVLGVRPDTTVPARDPFAFYGLAPVAELGWARPRIGGPHWLRRQTFLLWARARALAGRDEVIFTRDLGVAHAILSLPRRPPLVYESHGFAPVFAATLPDLVVGARPASLMKRRRLERRERDVWRRADGYVSTTRVLVDELVATFGPRTNCEVIPNGCRPAPAPTSAPSRDAPIVGYAGHLYPWKGVDILLRAMADVPGVRVLVVGGRPGDADMARVTALAASLGIADRTTFVGFVPAAEVGARMAEARVCVLPTTDTASARYTSPLKMFEYMVLDRPIVASDLASIREVLTDGRNALLVSPGDVPALATAVQRLLADADLARRLAAQARVDATAYSWDKRAEKLEALIEQVSRTGG